MEFPVDREIHARDSYPAWPLFDVLWRIPWPNFQSTSLNIFIKMIIIQSPNFPSSRWLRSTDYYQSVGADGYSCENSSPSFCGFVSDYSAIGKNLEIALTAWTIIGIKERGCFVAFEKIINLGKLRSCSRKLNRKILNVFSGNILRHPSLPVISTSERCENWDRWRLIQKRF